MLCAVALLGLPIGLVAPNTFPAVGPVDTLTSGLASIARLPYGTDVASVIRESGGAASQQEPSLTLYEFEACPFCRRVREMITYLDRASDSLPRSHDSLALRSLPASSL